MAQYYPVIFPAGISLAGDSIGFRAYSLRVDNCTNQWYFEETSVAFIPPYSLGMCLRLYGTGVAMLLAQAPVGQPQLAPIAGEQLVGVYSDQLRTEVAASPIRQFTLVQSVSDLTEGPQPALPPVGVDRLYADATGNIHHLHSNGIDLTLVDPSNAGTLLYPTFDPHYQAMMGATALGADLYGTVSAAHVGLRNNSVVSAYDSGGTLRNLMGLMSNNDVLFYNAGAQIFVWVNQANTQSLMTLDNTGNLGVGANLTVPGNAGVSGTATVSGPLVKPTGSAVMWTDANTQIWADSSRNLYFDTFNATWSWRDTSASGTPARMTLSAAGGLSISGTLSAAGDVWANGGHFYLSSGAAYWYFDGSRMHTPNNLMLDGTQLSFQGSTGLGFSTDGTYTHCVSSFIGNGNIACQNVTPSYGFTAPNAGAAYGQGYANAWINASSREWKGDIAELGRALELLTHQALHAVSYTHRGEGPHGKPSIGFVADDWAPHVPELVSFDETGKPVGMDYARVGAITFEALKQYIARTDARLAALEGAA